MSQGSVLYRFHLELSDIDRGVYCPLDFRLAMHPSETVTYLGARVIAYALNHGPDLAFAAGGIADDELPAISSPDPRGGFTLWIEIGAPSAKRLRKAMNAAQTVKVYVHRDPQGLVRELRSANLRRLEALEIYSFAKGFFEEIGSWLERDNTWLILLSDGLLSVSDGTRSAQSEITRLNLQALIGDRA